MPDKKPPDKSILNCCPNCRCNNLKYVRVVSRRLPFWWRIECWNCHYCGKTKLFLKRAIKSWNKEMEKKKGKRKWIKN